MSTRPDRLRMGSAPLHSPSTQPSDHRVRSSYCALSKPAALVAFALLTLVWLWITAHPLLSRKALLVHALHIDVPVDEVQAHEHAGVLVQPADDLAAVSRWRAVLHHLHHQEALPAEPDDPSDTLSAAPPFSCYGVHAQRGRRRHMEDTHAVYLRHRLDYSSAAHAHLCSRDTEEGQAERVSPWALFGVFDGHGGALASEYAAAYLLPSLHSSLLHHGYTSGAAALPPQIGMPAAHSPNLTACFSNAFQRLDEEFLDLIARPQKRDDGSTALVAGISYSAEAESRGESSFQLVVANLGDCRAVLVQAQPAALESSSAIISPSPDSSSLSLPDSSSPQPEFTSAVVALSRDHKPELPEERSFVESHRGGFVSSTRGGRALARVQGVLAVSRAIGDAPLKPFVRSEPDVRVLQLDALDEDEAHCPFDEPVSLAPAPTCGVGDAAAVGVASPLLLLASDGFWDVFDNEGAGREALDFLRLQAGASSSSGVPLLSALAHHLVAQAYLRGSMDNLTLMAIDVRCMQQWLRQQAREAAAQGAEMPEEA